MIPGQTWLNVIVLLPLPVINVIDRTLPTGFFNEKGDSRHRFLKAVVDDMDGVELIGQDSLRVGQSQPFGDMGLRITPAPQTRFLLGRRWRFDKYAQGFGVALPYLGRPLDINLQQDIAASRRIGLRCSVEVSGDLCPLHEATLGDFGSECSFVGEYIGSVWLAGTTYSSGP